MLQLNVVRPDEVDTPMLRLAGRTTCMSDKEANQMAEAVVLMGVWVWV